MTFGMCWMLSGRVRESDIGLTRPELVRGVAEGSTQRVYETVGSFQDLRVFRERHYESVDDGLFAPVLRDPR
jgi:hypothetical protein